MKIKLEKGINLVFKKNGTMEDCRSYRTSLFDKDEVVLFEGYDNRFSSFKMCVFMDGEGNNYLCEEDKIDEMFKVLND